MHEDSALVTMKPTRLAVFVIGYFLSVRLSEQSYGTLAVPSPFWLPDSVFLCTLLLAPRSHWWMYALLVWPVRLAAGAVGGTPLSFQLLAIANDTGKGLVGAWLLHRYSRQPIRLGTLSEFLWFVGIAAAALPAISAMAAAPMRHVLGDPVWRATYQWFLGNALTQVVVTPTLLYWCTRRIEGRRQWAEMLVVSCCLSGALFVGLTLTQASHWWIFLYLPVPFLMWAAVRLGPLGTATSLSLVAIVSMVAAVAGTGIFAGEPAQHVVPSIQLFLLLLGVSLLSLTIVVSERAELHAREIALGSRLIETQDRERSLIAGALHDEIGQQMTLLVMNIEQLRKRPDMPEDAQRQASDLAGHATDLAISIQGLSHKLHPLTIDLMGLEGAVRQLGRQFSGRDDFHAEVRSHAVPTELRPDISLCLYRVIQEGLHNVVKHSGVNNASIELHAIDGRITVAVTDAGRGFDTARLKQRSGLGLSA